MGTASILAQDAKLIADIQEQTFDNVKIPNFNEDLQTYGQSVSSKVGTTRALVKSLSVNNQEFIVVGELNANQIKSGDPFIITNKTDTELVSNLQSSENTQRTMLIAAAWISCFIGFSMIFAPILELVSWIPLFGNAAKFAAGVISMILATILVLMGYLFIKFWFVFVILLVVSVVLAIFLVFKVVTSKKKAQ